VSWHLDAERAYRIIASRDARYDGVFIAGAISTGVYCRPSCAKTLPLRRNVRFFESTAAAQEAGLRACKRCQPDGMPGSATWNRRADIAARAFRLIVDGLVDREGVAGLARRVGYSERQLHRILVAELGAGALSLARAQRAQSARLLIDSSDLSLGEVALAAGFGSIRQFNDTMQSIYATTPSKLRENARRSGRIPKGIRLQLACRQPFDGQALVRFLKRHEVPSLERVCNGAYTRALSLDRGGGVVTLTPGPDALTCELRLDDLRDLTAAVARCRRLFDLDADPQAVDAHLSASPVIRDLVRGHPGVRIPGAVDGFELAVRTIIRHKASYERARATTAALVRRYGAPLRDPVLGVTHRFPTAAALTAADPSTFGVDTERAHAIHELSARSAAGDIRLDAGSALDESVAQLLAIPGIGTWIASYIAMRAIGDPDVFLVDCDRITRALARAGVPASASQEGLAEAWRPWRSYAIAALWRSLDDEDRSEEPSDAAPVSLAA
jgi:AraC family transcriptional regulator, regulatory protein of adaptative response / DNA-3-methyladenine glycosylase II